MSFFDLFSDAKDLASEAIIDKDKKIQLDAKFDAMLGNIYLAELNTKTVPWVDALHKMGRQIFSFASVVIPAALLWKHPELNPASIAAMLAPGGIYSYVKGKGK